MIIEHDRRKTKFRTYYWSEMVTIERSREEIANGERPKLYLVTVAARSDNLKAARKVAEQKAEALPPIVKGMMGAYIQCHPPSMQVADIYELQQPILIVE